jgi:hypothetical protein
LNERQDAVVAWQVVIAAELLHNCLNDNARLEIVNRFMGKGKKVKSTAACIDNSETSGIDMGGCGYNVLFS